MACLYWKLMKLIYPTAWEKRRIICIALLLLFLAMTCVNYVLVVWLATDKVLLRERAALCPQSTRQSRLETRLQSREPVIAPTTGAPPVRTFHELRRVLLVIIYIKITTVFCTQGWVITRTQSFCRLVVKFSESVFRKCGNWNDRVLLYRSDRDLRNLATALLLN